MQHGPARANPGDAELRHLAVHMRPHEVRALILRAVREPGGLQLDLIIAQLLDAERAREILRAKGYGASGMSASATAAQVPPAANH